MKRAKRHRVKSEKPETSTSYARAVENHDLAYYIHDRVELMHQVFSVIKSKDLRAMAPDSVRKLPMDDLQELCTEELLGISSKRLCAILDGAEPPSDTESSSGNESPTRFETISLDSISSDDEMMSQSSKKKKHKHKKNTKAEKEKKKKKHKEQPNKGARNNKDKDETTETQDSSKASRAGLTVLELLELQARARAIRAQLMQDHSNKQQVPNSAPTTQSKSSSSSDSEVEIKEEAPEVVEISSDDNDEKPNVMELQKANNIPSTSKDSSNKEPEQTEKSKETPKRKEKKNKKDKNKSKKKKKDKGDDNKRDSISTDEVPNKRDSISNNEVSNKRDSISIDEVSDKRVPVSIVEKVPNKETEIIINTKEVNTKDIANKPDAIDITDPNKVTKRINNLIITVPQQHLKKIKLNRNKITVQIPNVESEMEESVRNVVVTEDAIESVVSNDVANVATTNDKAKKDKVKRDKSKKKKRQERKSPDKEGSDHDEITLQLSDTEKMDLLEDFDRKGLDNVSSSGSSSSDSESDSSDSTDDTNEPLDNSVNNTSRDVVQVSETNKDDTSVIDSNEIVKDKDTNVTNLNKTTENPQDTIVVTSENINLTTRETIIENNPENNIDTNVMTDKNDLEANTNEISNKNSTENTIVEETVVITDINDLPIQNSGDNSDQEDNSDKQTDLDVIELETESKNDGSSTLTAAQNNLNVTEISNDDSIEESQGNSNNSENNEHVNTINSANEIQEVEENSKEIDKVVEKDEINETVEKAEDLNKELSDGEISEHSSSEVEAYDLKPEVLCISDEEDSKSKKKKNKKEKKCKKSKKKSKSNFREGRDQNFYKDNDNAIVIDENGDTTIIIYEKAENKLINNEIVENTDTDEAITIDDDELIEILELSDDSSCYEVEGTVLSKEPTVAEIEALSAAIDDIKREDIITDAEIKLHEKQIEEKAEIEEINETELENISWKDRYLGSKKVKKVLTTSNILNALRKKNKELKRKMEESKKKEIEETQIVEKVIETVTELQEGSIDHYNTLQGSTRFVDPVKEIQVTENIEDSNKTEDNADKNPENIEDSNKIDENTDKNPENIEDSNKTEEIDDKIQDVEINIQVTGEMKKDAKQLLKIYKRLLKYNDVNKQKDPNKKKKKSKKKKDKAPSKETAVN